MKRKPSHKYRVGDLVGIIVDCMANCRIIRCIPKRKGKGLSYIATAERIHSSRPEESFFGKNKEFEVLERNIMVKLR